MICENCTSVMIKEKDKYCCPTCGHTTDEITTEEIGEIFGSDDE